MDAAVEWVKNHLWDIMMSLRPPKTIEILDIIQVLIIAYFVYHMILWVKNTKAYLLLKGIIIIAFFVLVANVFHMDVILAVLNKLSVAAITAVVIIFQPELRRMLEQLGDKKILDSLVSLGTATEDEGMRFSDRTLNDLVRASFDMGEVKTGALIVLEQNISLDDYIKTGIQVDAVLTSQLLINIFEHNTPLHDGAVIVRGNRVVAATCYLPLSENMALNKNLGTRHRAGAGISEVSDSLTIIVSEETGKVSYARNGELKTGVTPSELREQLHKIQKLEEKQDTSRFRRWKGLVKHEKNTDK